MSRHREHLERAREEMGRALELLRRFPDLPCAEATRFDLSAALSSAGDAETEGEEAVAHLSHVMSGLRCALGRMQDACADRPELEPATVSIARAVAVLYPLCSLPCSGGDGADPASVEPIPLVRRAPDGEFETPIPLSVARRRASVVEDMPLPLTARRGPSDARAEERRNVARKSIHAELGIQSDTNFYTGFACDISSGGLFVATYDLPKVGASVMVNFRLPGGPLMSLLGTVRWVREPDDAQPDLTPGMGVSFEGLPQREAAAINAYMAEHPPLFFET